MAKFTGPPMDLDKMHSLGVTKVDSFVLFVRFTSSHPPKVKQFTRRLRRKPLRRSLFLNRFRVSRTIQLLAKFPRRQWACSKPPLDRGNVVGVGTPPAIVAIFDNLVFSTEPFD